MKRLQAALIGSLLIAGHAWAETKDKPTVTAEQQSDAPADVEITRKIRQAVTDDDSLSVEAKNVQIITRQGKVVLKGEVKSPQEKDKVTTLATNVAGKANVKSEIVVNAH